MNEQPENSVERRSGLEEYSKLEEYYADRLPKHWDTLTYAQKLDWFGHRMLLDQREEIRQEQGNQAARDWGFLSEYQLERRRRREVQSKLDSWDDVPPRRGSFYRQYVDPTELRHGKKKEEDGPKEA